MPDNLPILEGFVGREEELRAIKRFRKHAPMFYRAHDLVHAKRVYWSAVDAVPAVFSVYPGFEPELVFALAAVHDDAEIITGDVPLGVKRRMNEGQKRKQKQDEEHAILELVEQWPEHVDGFVYRDLLYHAMMKDCAEAQFVSWLDKTDGYCESLHEVFAGNQRFVRTAEDYVEELQKLPKEYPVLVDMLKAEHPMMHIPTDIDTAAIATNGRFHDEETVLQRTGIPSYDRWKKITAERIGLDALVSQKES